MDAWKRHGTVALPAAVLCGALGLHWCLVRGSYTADPESRLLAFFGWLGILLIVFTCATILCAGAAKRVGSAVLRAAFLTAAVLTLLGLVSLCDSLLGRAEFFRLSLLFIAWAALWTVIPLLLRRCGAGISVGLPLAAAMVLIAGPVTLAPVARAVPWKDAGGAAFFSREHIAQGIEIASPLLGMLDAARPAIVINWQTLPHMYAMAEGQEVAFSLPGWWANALAYAAAALLLAIPAWLIQAKRLPAATVAPPRIT